MSDDIRESRQPVVTSLGIILGFVLNFLAQWAIRDDGRAPIESATDWVIVVTLFVAVAIMLVVLFGFLSNSYNTASAASRYQRLLQLYVIAIAVAFMGLAIALFV